MEFFSLICFMLHVAVAVSTQSCQVKNDTLTCYLRTLQSADIDIAIGERDRVGISNARKLHVRCSDVFFFESQLKSEHFGSLPALEELDIEFCKIRSVPPRAFAGLSSLKRLSVQSHNSEWTSILLDVDPNGFRKINSIQELNLAHNNLWSLPTDSLCDLPHLRILNISQNHLLDVADLGLANIEGCSLSLQELDLSNNYISSLSSNVLHQVPQLRTLHMRENRLSILDDNALSYLNSLQEVDFSNNQLAALPPTIFNGSQDLRRLMLQNNSLSLLTPELIRGLSNLTLLNLSHNAISTHLLSEETFQDLESLEILDLSHNKLTRLEAFTFTALSSIQVLNLAHNQIHVISSRAFLSHSLLRILVLSHNKIDNVDAETINGLNMLTSVSLDHNQMEELNLNSSFSSLTDLALNNNNITEVPSFIINCKNLSTLDLGENYIKKIDAKSGFNKLKKLYGLRLAGNQIESISNDTFFSVENATESSSLHVLNLAKNKLKNLEQGTLNTLQNLHALRLDGNQLADINGVVSSLSNLEWFNVSTNNLEWFDYAFVPPNISWLDISSNKIGELGNFFNLKANDFSVLQTIDASSNILSSIDENTFAPVAKSLRHVRLNGNNIGKINPNSFSAMKNLEQVELRNNQLEHLKKEALSTSFKRYKGPLTAPNVHLFGNPFICDCNLGWLQTINGVNKPTTDDKVLRRRQRHHHYMQISDLEDIACSNSIDLEKMPSKVIDVPSNDFICPYKTHCFDLCMCCDFYACDCRMQCPHGCDCSHDSTWSRNIITCSARNHTAVPLLIPMDSTHVYLDGNDLRHSVVQQNFLGRHRVRHMYLNGSNIITLGNNTFSGLVGLRTLHLEDNRLENIGYVQELATLVHLEELYLHNNELRSIAATAFESLRSLRVLRLDANLLTTFHVWDALPMPPNSMTSIALAQNMWSCECEFLTIFNDFLEANIRSIVDYNSVQCVSSNDLVIGNGENCPPTGDPTSYVSDPKGSLVAAEGLNLVTILVPALVAMIMLILGILAVCVFRQGIKNWLYNHGNVITKSSIYGGSMAPTSDLSSSGGESSNSNANKLFDVYVSYCAEDSEFVDTTLGPTLEHGGHGHLSSAGTNPTYRVCLQRRDFPTNADFQETAVVAAESSARVLVVMSKRYLNVEWHKFKTPLKRALSNQADGKLIILFLEDLASVDDPELVHYIRTCPTIKWGAAGFLNKLRFFLPEPAFLTFQRNITLRTLRSASSDPPLQFVPALGGDTDILRKKKMPRLNSNCGCSQTPNPIHSETFQLGFPYGHSDHTYHSIPDDNNHIYHTLEPSLFYQQQERFNLQQPPVRPDIGMTKNCHVVNDLNRTSSPNAANARAVFLNRNLDLVLKVDPPRNSLSPVLPSVCHAYTQSTSSGQQLIPCVTSKSSLTKNNTDEYIV